MVNAKIAQIQREVQLFKAGERTIFHLPSHSRSDKMLHNKTPNKNNIKEYVPRTAFRLGLQLSEFGYLYKYEITLTYPEEFPMNGLEVRRHRLAILRKMKRYGMKEYTWSLEFQERGAPHIHILLDAWIGKKKLKNAWYEIVGSGDLKHLEIGAMIAQIGDITLTRMYIASYARKKDQKQVPAGYENVGKFWGSNRSVKPSEIITTEYETEKQLMRENRNLTRWRKAKKREVGLAINSLRPERQKSYKAWKVRNGKGFFSWMDPEKFKAHIEKLDKLSRFKPENQTHPEKGGSGSNPNLEGLQEGILIAKSGERKKIAHP